MQVIMFNLPQRNNNNKILCRVSIQILRARTIATHVCSLLVLLGPRIVFVTWYKRPSVLSEWVRILLVRSFLHIPHGQPWHLIWISAPALMDSELWLIWTATFPSAWANVVYPVSRSCHLVWPGSHTLWTPNDVISSFSGNQRLDLALCHPSQDLTALISYFWN